MLTYCSIFSLDHSSTGWTNFKSYVTIDFAVAIGMLVRQFVEINYLDKVVVELSLSLRKIAKFAKLFIYCLDCSSKLSFQHYFKNEVKSTAMVMLEH